MIDLWYGHRLRLGHLGTPQRWVNILGRVSPDVESLTASLDGGPGQAIAIGPDGHRLARRGDFNVEIDRAGLTPGRHELELAADPIGGGTDRRLVELQVTEPKSCPLPYTIDWSTVGAIRDVAAVVDGRWELTPAGVRSVEPYYDRVIGLGDLNWTDVEVSTTVTFHGLIEPDEGRGDAGAGVIHAALATRWPGHDDDGRQPRVKWWPLGATAEFRVNSQWSGCSWRILGGEGVVANSPHGRGIALDRPYGMKHRVEELPDGGARYRVKLWEASEPEPDSWDLELIKGPAGQAAGGVLLIAHYTDLTFGNVDVKEV